jgi:hypothetical protein
MSHPCCSYHPIWFPWPQNMNTQMNYTDFHITLANPNFLSHLDSFFSKFITLTLN